MRSSPLVVLALLAVVGPAVAQPPAPQLIPPSPQAPSVATVSPSGVQRGQAVELTLTGTNLNEPTVLWTSFAAKASFPADNNNGKEPAKLRVRLEVPADAPVGYHSVRLATRWGVSNLKLFCVDDLPQVAEVDTNRTKAAAQAVTLPCVVTGRTDAEASDFFKVSVKPNQRLTIDVIGHRLGNPLDPIVLLHDAKTGRELPGVYSDDAPGQQTDPRLVHTFKEGGEYLIEVRDATHRGGADFFYRMRLGDFPLATAALPLAMKRGSKAPVAFTGPAVEGVSPVEVMAPADANQAVLQVAPRGPSGQLGWPVPVLLSDFEQVAEQEPNNEPAKAQRLPVPGGVTSRFLDKGDLDHFVFPAKKGQKLAITAATQEVGSPAEVYLTLRPAPAAGMPPAAELAKTDPQKPPRIDFTAPADGDFLLTVEHLNYVSGPNEVYHLQVVPVEPDFDVSLGLDRVGLPPGGTAVIPIPAAVRRDYNGPIELKVDGHPGLTGTVTLPAGNPPAPNLPAGFLVVTAAGDLPRGAYDLRVQAKATINGKDVVKLAGVDALVKPGLGNLVYPPRDLGVRLAAAVTDKPPFVLTAKLATPEAVRGIAATVTVAAARAGDFPDEITLAPVGVPPNVAPAAKNIAKGANESAVTLTPAANAALANSALTFVGRGKYQGRDFAVVAVPITLTVALPFELKVEPAEVKLAPGAKAKVKVTAVRKGGYKGPIDVELKNLPAGVTAAKTPIPMDKTEAEVELTAAANAAVAAKADVNATGTATAAANQQAASPNFKVEVAK